MCFIKDVLLRKQQQGSEGADPGAGRAGEGRTLRAGLVLARSTGHWNTLFVAAFAPLRTGPGLCVPSLVSHWPSPGKGWHNFLMGNFWQVGSRLPRLIDLWGCRCQPLVHIILSSWEMGIPVLQMERETQVKRLSSLPWSMSHLQENNSSKRQTHIVDMRWQIYLYTWVKSYK